MGQRTLLIVLIVMGASTAWAQAPGGPAVQQEAAPAHTMSITLSPIHLGIGPIVEVTGEWRAAPKIGAAGILGFGKYEPPDDPNVFDVFEAGASLRYYVLGDFSGGLQLGFEALYVKLSTDSVNGSNVSAIGNGLSLAPFIGYKAIWSGFTFDGQIGASFLAVSAEADNGETAEDQDVGVLLNLNVGWSF